MRKKLIALLSVTALLLTMLAVPVLADGTRVVTIGQDLSDEQEAFIINYFGVDLNTAQVIYVNNQQEREYVGSWIPLEQIGNITISSAYVQPTNSGGIQVKTANLTYVTGNMIASVLSTAGVKNCNIVAAAPFPVSGTGALTGVMIAYQVATGETLNEAKRDLAVQEFTVTQQASQSIGEEEALQLVNAVKMEVIQSEVPADDSEQIAQIVNDVINNVEQSIIVDNSVTNIDNTTVINNALTDEDRQLIIDLATEIAKQEYQYEDVKDTLERVEENLSRETNINIVIDNSNEVNNDTNVDVSQDNDVNVDNQNDASNQNDVDNSNDNTNEADADNDSILSNTNDDLIDASYQSSTREEDIIAIENELAQEEPETETTSGLYDMSDVEEYYEVFPVDGPGYDNPYPDPEDGEPQTDYFYVDPTEEQVPVDTWTMEEQEFLFGGEPETDNDIYVPEAPEYEEPETEDLFIEEPENPVEAVPVGGEFADAKDGILPNAFIRVYVEQADYLPANGTLEFKDVFDQTLRIIDLSDEELVVSAAISDEELQELGWSEGTQLDIFVPADAWTDAASVQISAQTETTTLELAGDISPEKPVVRLNAERVDDLRAGKEVVIAVTTEGEGLSVIFEIDDPEIAAVREDSAMDVFTEDGSAREITVDLLKEGETSVTVHIQDADGNELDTYEILLPVYPEKTDMAW